MAEFSYEIIENIATFGFSGGWQIELNKISWNKRPPVLDIRKWSDTHEKMGKGISLKEAELAELCDALNEYFNQDEES